MTTAGKSTVIYWLLTILDNSSCPLVCTGDWLQDTSWIPKSMDSQNPLDYLLYLIQCKCYVISHWHAANWSFAFWNTLDFSPKYLWFRIGCICRCGTCGYRKPTVYHLIFTSTLRKSIINVTLFMRKFNLGEVKKQNHTLIKMMEWL